MTKARNAKNKAKGKKTHPMKCNACILRFGFSSPKNDNVLHVDE